jgi:hypothetical protein
MSQRLHCGSASVITDIRQLFASEIPWPTCGRVPLNTIVLLPSCLTAGSVAGGSPDLQPTAQDSSQLAEMFAAPRSAGRSWDHLGPKLEAGNGPRCANCLIFPIKTGGAARI